MDIHNNQEQYISYAAEMIRALDNTGVRMFMYYPKKKLITVPQKTCAAYNCKAVYENMPDSFAEDYVCEEDYPVFKEMYYSIDKGEKTATAIFHSKDLNYCNHVTLTTISTYEDGSPKDVFGLIEDMSDTYKNVKLVEQLRKRICEINDGDDSIQEAISLIANSISESYITIFHIWAEDLTYVCFQDEAVNYSESTVKRVPIKKEHVKQYLDNCIEQKYRSDLQHFFDFDTLVERLGEKNSIEYVYRRKKYGWTKAQYIVAKRDNNNVPLNIIFTVRDINYEIEREEKNQKAQYELLHDPLTKAYNRKAFEEMTKSSEDNNKQIMFALVDVDDFKGLNDNFGHEVGDQVLQHIVDNFFDTFRNNDFIFRVGGDEFAIIMNECNADIWKSFCRKQQYLHRHLHECFPQTKEITISIGMCYSLNGYHDELYSLADEALYQTKNNGRSGCTLIDDNHNIVKQWRDDNFTLQTETALDRSATGVFRMEFSDNKDELPRMFCSETTKVILGVSSNATPEQCYASWFEGIDESYHDALNETRRTMLEEGQAECTYLWSHPTWGKIFVRSGGFGVYENGVSILQGYHHSLKNTKIIEKSDDSKLLFSALSDVYFASYYIDLEKQTYATFKVAPGEDNLQMQDKSISEILEEFIDVLVSDKDKEKMRHFLNLSTLQQRIGSNKYIDCEYRSQGLKGWCRARFIPIKHNEDNKLITVLFAIAALDSATAKELDVTDYNKRSLSALFNNVPGVIVMYEFDGRELKTLHISSEYIKKYGYTINNQVNNCFERPEFMNIHPQDISGYKAAIKEALYKTHSLHYVFRTFSIPENRYLWIRIDAAVSPQSEGTSLIYAIYTDVSDQKESEINIEKKQASLEAALDMSDQVCFEFDPQNNTMECLVDDNFFGLPKIVKNFPNELKSFELIHPEDFDIFINTVNSFDGKQKEQCNIRCLRNDEYRWFSFNLLPYYDVEKNHNIAFITVNDITLRIDAMNSYEERLRSLLAVKDNLLSMCLINVTKNTFKMVNYENIMDQFIDESESFESVILGAADNIIGEDNKKKYYSLFNRSNLLNQAENGNMHVQYEYMIKLEEKHYEWIVAAVDLIQNPVTGDICGAAYTRSIQKEKMSKGLLDKIIKQDYLFAAIVMTDTDEFYLYNSQSGDFLTKMDDYWDVAIKDAAPRCSAEELAQIKLNISKENVLSHLENEEQYKYSHNSFYQDKICRLEIRFSYLDESRSMLIVSMRNITDISLLQQFKHDSEHDSLTDLYNRKTVFKKCRELLAEHPKAPFVMVHVDMKHFKLYNTFFGDEEGDKLLICIGDLFREMNKDYEYSAYGRIEADVFCAFFPFDEKVYNRHISMCLEYLKNYRSDFLIEPVIGMYFVDDIEMPVEAMFTRATLAAKESKTSASLLNKYDNHLELELNEKHQIINDMQNAIEEEQFKVYFQPKYSLRTNRIIGSEALVRWIHPTKGMISPGKFIPIFESNGFITVLDRYMWEHVCMALSRWKKEGRVLTKVSVNVSRISMFGSSTVDFLKELVARYDIEPEYLELELTESAFIDDPKEMKKQMFALKEAGFTILMDDFGSGYSSLNTLRELPVDILKLDMKFLPIDSRDIRGNLVLSSIVRMSKLLKLVVIAEGVEFQEQADFLKGIGCEYVQGFLFARPMPINEFEECLAHIDYQAQNVNTPSINHIGRIIAESDSVTYAMGSVLPVPLAFMEYSKGSFTILRVNPEFFKEFGLEEDLSSASMIFGKQITEDSFSLLIKSFDECISNRKKMQVPILWKLNDGSLKKYICTISYEGKIGSIETFVTVFTAVNI